MAEHNEIGKIGENICRKFLMKQGFTILETNYRTKYGELDIIAKKDNVLRFVEVKSVKVRDLSAISELKIQPEDNLTKSKWSKLLITTSLYLEHKNLTDKVNYQMDLACVYINTERREGRVALFENIHIE
jgi:putative endonuclease